MREVDRKVLLKWKLRDVRVAVVALVIAGLIGATAGATAPPEDEEGYRWCRYDGRRWICYVWG